jgi:hypothetical protein
MVKKILKITGITFAILLIAGFSIPYLFEKQIKEKIKATANESVNATVNFTEADLSLFKNFPNATISLEKLVIINKAPFEGDTLVSLEQLQLKMSVLELFNSSDKPMKISGITSKNGLINIIKNKDGIGNYDIAIKDTKTDSSTEAGKPLALKINNYEIENFKLKFTDEASKMKVVLDSLNHAGKGDFTNDILDLDTHTTTKISMTMEKVNYMKNIAISLDAVLGMNMKTSTYTFKENKAKINELPLEFDGFIQMITAGQNYDLKFKTPTSSFKNFLGLIPEAYASSIENVKTTGDFTVTGFAKGLFSETTIPKFNIAIHSKNGSFQYPDLPKSVKNIIIDTKIINETGKMDDTFVNLDQLSFAIDQDVFNAKATIKNVATNALVDAKLNGTINLGNLSKAYPIKLDKPLSGILKANVTSKFDMKSVETSQYQNINNAGNMSLTGFNYTDEAGKTMNISTAVVAFNPSRVNLQAFKATTGKSDINVTGVLDNFYGFIFRNQELKGNFNMKSNQIAVNDFMTTSTPETEENKTSSDTDAMKIPAFLNCVIKAQATTVLYDNLVLKNTEGVLVIKDQKVTLENVKTAIFGGQIGFNGSVSTKEKTPKFDMKMNLNQVDIYQTFTQLDMLKKIAPIAGIINGKLNSTMTLSGNLNDKKMTPNLTTLTGDLLGQLLSTTVNPTSSTLLNALDSKLNFIDLKKVNLNDLKTAISFQNGKVTIKPFDIKYQDITVNVGGTHGFDQSMNYNLKFDVPAKYLGNDASALIAKLSPSDVSKLSVPINASVTGSFSAPKVSTDVKQATANLVSNFAKEQKNKLVNKGSSALEELINKNTKNGDTTKTKGAVNQAKDLLNGLFKKKKP